MIFSLNNFGHSIFAGPKGRETVDKNWVQVCPNDSAWEGQERNNDAYNNLPARESTWDKLAAKPSSIEECT